MMMMMMGVASPLDIRVPYPSETRVHDERRTSLLARDATRARDVPRDVPRASADADDDDDAHGT